MGNTIKKWPLENCLTPPSFASQRNTSFPSLAHFRMPEDRTLSPSTYLPCRDQRPTGVSYVRQWHFPKRHRFRRVNLRPNPFLFWTTSFFQSVSLSLCLLYSWPFFTPLTSTFPMSLWERRQTQSSCLFVLFFTFLMQHWRFLLMKVCRTRLCKPDALVKRIGCS